MRKLFFRPFSRALIALLFCTANLLAMNPSYQGKHPIKNHDQVVRAMKEVGYTGSAKQFLKDEIQKSGFKGKLENFTFEYEKWKRIENKKLQQEFIESQPTTFTQVNPNYKGKHPKSFSQQNIQKSAPKDSFIVLANVGNSAIKGSIDELTTHAALPKGQTRQSDALTLEELLGKYSNEYYKQNSPAKLKLQAKPHLTFLELNLSDDKKEVEMGGKTKNIEAAIDVVIKSIYDFTKRSFEKHKHTYKPFMNFYFEPEAELLYDKSNPKMDKKNVWIVRKISRQKHHRFFDLGETIIDSVNLPKKYQQFTPHISLAQIHSPQPNMINQIKKLEDDAQYKGQTAISKILHSVTGDTGPHSFNEILVQIGTLKASTELARIKLEKDGILVTRPGQSTKKMFYSEKSESFIPSRRFEREEETIPSWKERPTHY